MVFINTFFNQYNKEDLKGFSKFLASLSPEEFTILACVLGISITTFLNNNEKNSIGNFLELMGQVILTNQAQEVLRQNES